ncbi:MAG: DUF5752 family protein [Syntrophaceae bacterium]
MPEENPPFAIKDCALISLATGRRAQNLRELRERIQTIDAESIYYHVWGVLLRPSFEDPEFKNDFASWCRHAIHDDKAAEKLSIIDPTEFDTLDELRAEIIDVIEERLEEIEFVRWAQPDEQFNFVTFQTVVFDTGDKIDQPSDLPAAIKKMSVSSIFYHFIDARRRTPGRIDDFREWLHGCGPQYDEICNQVALVDPFFPSLRDLRAELADVFGKYFTSG